MNNNINKHERIGSKRHPLMSAQIVNTTERHYGYWKITFGGDKLSICPRLMKILGVHNVAKMSFREIFEFIDIAHLSEFKKWIRNAANKKLMEPIKFRIHTRSDERKLIKLTGLHYSKQWQSPEVILGTVEDITNFTNHEKEALAIVNHEIRNPLAVIKLNAQLLERKLISNNNLSSLSIASVILRRIDAITSVLNQYLSDNDFISQGDSSIEFDLTELIEETLVNFKLLHPDYIFYLYTLEKCSIKASRYQIGQVLVNYLNNAVKFSPKNSRISIVVNIGFSSVEVGVTDEGIGVPDGQEKRIFDRFFKINKVADPKSSSSGLGLFLVKEIIEQYKGSVWMQKSRFGGSIFFFSLPESIRITKKNCQK